MIIELERQRSPVVVIAHQVINLVQPHFMPFHLLTLFMEGPLSSMLPLILFHRKLSQSRIIQFPDELLVNKAPHLCFVW